MNLHPTFHQMSTDLQVTFQKQNVNGHKTRFKKKKIFRLKFHVSQTKTSTECQTTFYKKNKKSDIQFTFHKQKKSLHTYSSCFTKSWDLQPTFR